LYAFDPGASKSRAERRVRAVAHRQRHGHNGPFHCETKSPMASKDKSDRTKSKKIVARGSEIHGKGVFATEVIEKGERIVRYKGRLRTHDEVDAEYGELDENGHTFLF